LPEFVVRQYHDGMAVPRQGVSVDSGRTNQKRRTRQAIVDAARQLLEQGESPTVAQAAELAGVGRTTAYRYFPTQEALLLELAVHADVDDVEDIVAAPPDGSAVDHLRAVLGSFNQHVFADEASYRTASRLYLDLWLAAKAAGDDEPVVREGRRRRWIEATLAPLRPSMAPATWDRLVAALTLVAGAETMITLRDVARLDAAAAMAVTDWAVQALVAAAIAEST
jgi:AcrR family transcriptional regulator